MNDIIEGNKIIAKFDHPDWEIADKVTYFGNKWSEYHSNWSWLMPVVEKIEALGYGVKIWNGAKGTYFVNIYKGYYGDVLIHKEEDSKIKAVWQTVIEFINWHNKQ